MAALAEWQGGQQDVDSVTQTPSVIYHPAMFELVAALVQAHAVAVFDWMHRQGAWSYQQPQTYSVRRNGGRTPDYHIRPWRAIR